MPQRINTVGPSIPQPVATALRSAYDRYGRDPAAKAFYNSAAWKKFRLSKLRNDPLCERCKRAGKVVAASHVHHKIELRDDWSRRLDWDNTESLCPSCHSRHHATS
jgi:5-methylcytosine-specific restriction enzyme A